MRLNIDIACDNAAFEDNGLGAELASILRKLADRLEGDVRPYQFGDEFPLHDTNGNRVGEATVNP